MNYLLLPLLSLIFVTSLGSILSS